MANIIDPLNQYNFFMATMFYQYLGTDSGSEKIRAFINPMYTDNSIGIEHIYQTILNGFKIDEAVGEQLDIIGNIIGLSRPTLSQIGAIGYFGFDGSPNQPFDSGEFADGRTSTEDALVGDDRYRNFLKIKIINNVWDGTAPSLRSLLLSAVDAEAVRVNNSGEDAVFSLEFTGGTVTQDDIDELLLLDLIPTPQGVQLDEVIVTEELYFTLEDGSVFTDENNNVFTIRGELE